MEEVGCRLWIGKGHIHEEPLSCRYAWVGALRSCHAHQEITAIRERYTVFHGMLNAKLRVDTQSMAWSCAWCWFIYLGTVGRAGARAPGVRVARPSARASTHHLRLNTNEFPSHVHKFRWPNDTLMVQWLGPYAIAPLRSRYAEGPGYVYNRGGLIPPEGIFWLRWTLFLRGKTSRAAVNA